jgi:hypothetical protein
MPSSFEKMLARLGDASYSIYLFQVFVISAVCKLVVKLFPPFPLDALIPILTLIAVLAGYLVYIFAEKPALDLCRRIGPLQRGGPRPAPVGAWRISPKTNNQGRVRRLQMKAILCLIRSAVAGRRTMLGKSFVLRKLSFGSDDRHDLGLLPVSGSPIGRREHTRLIHAKAALQLPGPLFACPSCCDNAHIR